MVEDWELTVKKLKLGGHMSAKAGLKHVVLNSRALQFDVVQLMLSDGREYQPYDFEEGTTEEFRKVSYGLTPFVHLPYVINPCESRRQRIGFYKNAFRLHCKLADELGARAVIIHPGYKKELEEDEARANLVDFLDSAWDEDWNLKILLETDAGSKNGSAIGSAEFIQQALLDLNQPQFGMCIDTVHLYARGIDLWEPVVRSEFLEEFQPWIKLVHLNSPDENVSLGSNRDRHNSPFSQYDWDHKSLFEALLPWPCILERRSLAIQAEDAKFIRKELGIEVKVSARKQKTS